MVDEGRMTNDEIEAFASTFGVWQEAQAYLDVMVDEREMRLILGMQGLPVTVDGAANLLNLSHDEAAELLARCYSRGVVNKKAQDGVTLYTPADFYARLDFFVKHEPERWNSLPREARRAIDRRYLDEFIARQRTKIEAVRQGAANETLPNDDILLLSELEEMLDAADEIVVLPCDCRLLGQNCERPVETCLRFNQAALDALDRGHGRRLTRDEAKALVRHADKQGLMHTGHSQWKEQGLHDACNCCACDCYPFRAGIELGSKGIWPASRYVAVHDEAKCNLCGACVKRCHFEAFYLDGSTRLVEGKAKPVVCLDAAKCWGCGLCANTCPSGAIEMERIQG